MNKNQDDRLENEQEQERTEEQSLDRAARIARYFLIAAGVVCGVVLLVSNPGLLGFFCIIGPMIVCTVLILRKLDKIIQLLDKK